MQDNVQTWVFRNEQKDLWHRKRDQVGTERTVTGRLCFTPLDMFLLPLEFVGSDDDTEEVKQLPSVFSVSAADV